MRDSVEIRPIQPNEITQARWLIYTVARELFHPEMTLDEAMAYWDERGTLKDLDDLPKNYIQNGGVFLVTILNGQVIGTGAFNFYSESVCELRRLWLLPQYQGRGFGYAMLMELVRQAKAFGYQKMCLLTDPIHQLQAVAFYRQVGFEDMAWKGDEENLWMEMEIG